MADTGITNIRGKEYQTVALRVSKFREACPMFSLTSTVIAREEDYVVMQAQIADETGRILATGHAEEYRKASQINRTSALENCETSAIGRALAAFGFGGTEFATANEVLNAIHQQDGKRADAGQSSSTVSQHPPANDTPAKRQKLDGPHTSKTALWNAVRAFTHDLHGCGDLDMFEAFLAEKDSVALIEQCKRDAPQLLEGGEGMPEDYVPINQLIKRMRADFELIENSALRTG